MAFWGSGVATISTSQRYAYRVFIMCRTFFPPFLKLVKELNRFNFVGVSFCVHYLSLLYLSLSLSLSFFFFFFSVMHFLWTVFQMIDTVATATEYPPVFHAIKYPTACINATHTQNVSDLNYVQLENGAQLPFTYPTVQFFGETSSPACLVRGLVLDYLLPWLCEK